MVSGRTLRESLHEAGISDPDTPPDASAWKALLASLERQCLGVEDERDKLGVILGAIRAAVLEIGADGTILYQNPAAREMLGALVGQRLFEVVQLDDARARPIELEWAQERLRAGHVLHEPDGAVHPMRGLPIEASWTCSPLHPQGGEPGSFVLTVTDLSNQKQVERDLNEARVEAEVARRSERTRGQFLANMSHELRTPLNGIIGYAELLAEEWAPGHPQVQHDIERILHSGHHLLGLINDVLDLSKVDAGRMHLNVEEVDLTALLEEVVLSSQPLADRRGNELKLEVPPDLGRIPTDAARVRQCLYNLLSNAAKFTQDGLITVRARRVGQMIEFDVDDTGVGIPPEVCSRLFEPFSQADSSSTRHFGGTGLGLALTRAFAEMLGGSVSFVSEVYRGSCFTLRLPQRLDIPESDAPGERWTSGEGPTSVLVVDDDPSVFDLVARLLARDGIRVVGVPTAEQALAAALDERPAAVVLDVCLPGVNGWMALSALRGRTETRRIPVVVVTNGDDGRRTANRMHADAYLSKPFDRGRLLESLRGFLRKAQAAS
jgi:signal transduction histidine kinase/ActR/RegA family two-component response regulator